MKREDIHRCLLEVLGKKIPDKAELAEALMKILFIEKGAVYRRLRGEVPFSFYEVVNIAEKSGISLNSFICPDSEQAERFELNIIEYLNMNDMDYKQWEDYISLIASARNDPRSEISESSNMLPLAVYGKFDSLLKYFIFKYQYLFTASEKRISFDDLIVPERLRLIYKSYFNETKYFAKTIYIWDYLIFNYLVTDIRFFVDSNLISRENVQQIKKDLFALLDYVENTTLYGRFEETGNPVFFYISDVNLYDDYSCLKINDKRLSHIRTFILNSVTSTDYTSFEKIKTCIQSLRKSSTLISHSGAVYRVDFFEKQRKIIAELG
jgi:hypothetical protein